LVDLAWRRGEWDTVALADDLAATLGRDEKLGMCRKVHGYRVRERPGAAPTPAARLADARRSTSNIMAMVEPLAISHWPDKMEA